MFADVADPTTPLEVRIESPAKTGLVIGRKRMYAADDRSLTVNVAPYVRSMLETALFSAPLRSAPVRVVVAGAGVATYTSPYVTLAAGRKNLPANRILSAEPDEAVVGEYDFDEVAIVTSATVQPELVFVKDGREHLYMGLDSVASKEMIVIKADVRKWLIRLMSVANVPYDDVDRFILRLRLVSGAVQTIVERRYRVANRPAGVRLAWVNRYGAVDFHTFPTVEKQTHRPGETLHTLLSEPLGAAGAEWLAEILSAPTVWRMDADAATELEVVDGQIVSQADQPTYVAIDVKPKK